MNFTHCEDSMPREMESDLYPGIFRAIVIKIDIVSSCEGPFRREGDRRSTTRPRPQLHGQCSYERILVTHIKSVKWAISWNTGLITGEDRSNRC